MALTKHLPCRQFWLYLALCFMKSPVFFILAALACISSSSCRSNRYAQTQGISQPERYDLTTNSWVPANSEVVRPAQRPPAYVETEKTTEKVQIIDQVNPAPNEPGASAATEQIRPAIPTANAGEQEEPKSGGFFSRMGRAAGNTWKSVTGGS